ncbi:hypothetical protein EDC26_102130 [Paralcaligenes ureilyticus]|uniref:Uncharacterized protein n=1 Tax=Paralcaligenes ureilyticus TaxID=627131 RepID=A0A4R3M9E1_9BURK|nr:hypothetical protein EDC26_102130 [Paralcaligenes ureilyticus]
MVSLPIWTGQLTIDKKGHGRSGGSGTALFVRDQPGSRRVDKPALIIIEVTSVIRLTRRFTVGTAKEHAA